MTKTLNAIARIARRHRRNGVAIGSWQFWSTLTDVERIAYRIAWYGLSL